MQSIEKLPSLGEGTASDTQVEEHKVFGKLLDNLVHSTLLTAENRP